jgi:hypothetical protein
MQEEKDNKTNEGAATQAGAGGQKPDADATSSETLKDVEEKEKVSDTEHDDEGARSETPSPDGAFDESRGGSDPAGPM